MRKKKKIKIVSTAELGGVIFRVHRGKRDMQ